MSQFWVLLIRMLRCYYTKSQTANAHRLWSMRFVYSNVPIGCKTVYICVRVRTYLRAVQRVSTSNWPILIGCRKKPLVNTHFDKESVYQSVLFDETFKLCDAWWAFLNGFYCQLSKTGSQMWWLFQKDAHCFFPIEHEKKKKKKTLLCLHISSYICRSSLHVSGYRRQFAFYDKCIDWIPPCDKFSLSRKLCNISDTLYIDSMHSMFFEW